MSLIDEVNGIAAFIRSKFADAAIYRFEEPELPEQGAFVIQLRQDARRSETRSHTVAERQFAVLYYGQSAETALTVMETLSRFAMNETFVIPAGETGRHLRLESFTFDSPVRTDNALHKCAGVLQTQTREPIATETYDKMMRIALRMNTN
ncbi:hypothetical protein [Paenibacillus arenilitoris]|uniref:Uncharacterized protein n=1 Tax=Paenibacillus arenilitoris TaxID=2772299 RepID=A0A927CHR9_9BACL|nr:hypothetical protein [Paenibacillus arenilitoris]MBD2867744.1 hypothetical protein [Paenibacillus arenilitoris]